MAPAPGHITVALWPHGAPGAQPGSGPEIDTTTAKENLVAGKPVIRLGNVSTPTLALYTPQGKSTGAAIVVFPGGAYRILAIDLEGTEVCDWLNSAAITCVLVKYRVPDSGPYPKSSAALQDAQRALGIVRSMLLNGTLIRIASVYLVSLLELTFRPLSAPTSSNVSMIPSMPRTSSAAVLTSPP